MSEELKALLGSLKVSTAADAMSRINALVAAEANIANLSAAVGVLSKIEALAGAKGEECLGVIKAAIENSAKLEAAEQKLAEISAKAVSDELDAAFKAARDEKKLTPAEETELRAQVAAKDMTPKGVVAYLGKKAPNAILSGANLPPQQIPGGASGAKGYENLTTSERLKLQREDEDGFNALRSDWEKRGCPVV